LLFEAADLAGAAVFGSAPNATISQFRQPINHFWGGKVADVGRNQP
jgi:hypothetical protein